VENLVGLVVDEPFGLCSVNEPGQADLAPDIEADPQGRFHRLQTPGGRVDEVVVGVVAIDEELAGARRLTATMTATAASND
jgi:hypothetical protein